MALISWLLVVLAASAASPDDAVRAIVGEWRGTSQCVDRQVAPACTDEIAVYEITAAPGQPNAVTINADKVVDGKRVPMGALTFTYDAAHGWWSTELQNPRARGTWRLTVDGTSMNGTLILLPSNAVVRKISLAKSR